MTLTLIIGLLLTTATAAWARHLPATPKLDRLSHYRGTLNTIHKNKCLGKPRYRWTLWEVPPELRTYVIGQTVDRIRKARARTSQCVPWYVTRQIWAGNILGRESLGDPWPNCPDPHDGSGSTWQGTVNCENGGSWLDSPGFYRCGLQFHPNWENRFGRLCP